MTLEALKDVVESTPLKPFTPRLADGRSLRVENPHTCAFLGTGRTLFVAHPRTDRINWWTSS
ncbi:MAG: hypothetical protein KF859_10060 [Phycisphaeraceae bacterium]|nr:hypothetical protein [Phycisphaeraceae bacterium]